MRQPDSSREERKNCIKKGKIADAVWKRMAYDDGKALAEAFLPGRQSQGERILQQLRLPRLLGEGCVLQQADTAKIWGWSEPGEEVCVSLQEHEKRTRADAEGAFSVNIPLPKAGGPYVLKVNTASGKAMENRKVYVGEVFVCAGQSNMELPMRRVRERYPEEFHNGGAPFVHLYKVMERYEFDAPLKDHDQAGWMVCIPDKLEEISALSYFFGKQLQETLGVPVGILNLSLGGTPAEAWISRRGLEGLPEYLELADRYKDADFRRELMAHKEAEEAAWYARIEREEACREKACALEDAWKPIRLPGYLREAGLENFCGCVRLRRTFEVLPACAGRRGFLQLGTLTDSDQTYINGCFVGETGYCYPPRRYKIPEGVLRAGTNEIDIRLICRDGGGRMTPGKPYRIVWEDPCARKAEAGMEEAMPSVELAGQWEYQVAAATDRAPEQEFINRKPTGLFQGMVAPCLPFSVKGVVWYQGESNDGRPENYEELLCSLIRDWRAQWEQESLPFIIVQLPNCGIDIAPGDAWPEIREAQRRAGRLSDTAVTVNLDLGEDNDLHPLEKKEAAYRIVLAARGMIYKEKVVYQGPVPTEWQVENNEVCLTFDTIDSGELLLKECIPTREQFELAGADRTWYPAKAAVSGRCVRLAWEGAGSPGFLRYAWHSAPGGPLLYNHSGLPAGPFMLELTKEEEGESYENTV